MLNFHGAAVFNCKFVRQAVCLIKPINQRLGMLHLGYALSF